MNDPMTRPLVERFDHDQGVRVTTRHHALTIHASPKGQNIVVGIHPPDGLSPLVEIRGERGRYWIATTKGWVPLP